MKSINEKGKSVFPKLFDSIKVGEVELPNRMFFPPFLLGRANPDGTISDELLNFYIDLAEGGCGTIYTGSATVSPDSIMNLKSMRMYNKDHMESNKRLCEEITKRGSIPAIQLTNFGRQSVTFFTEGKPLLSPSDVPCPGYAEVDPNYKIKTMTIEDIENVKEEFIAGAVLAVEAGYKIVMIHAAHGYLLSSFLSPYTNKRTDDYGGTIQNRTRIVKEIVEGIREKVGNSIAIDVRINADDLFDVEERLKPEDLKIIIPILEKSGADMVNLSISMGETIVPIYGGGLKEEAPYTKMIDQVKEYANIPVGHASWITTLDKGEELIDNGIVDLIGLGRTQFADNDFIKKSVNKEDVNKCLWCGQCLFDLFVPPEFNSYCSVNEKYKRPKRG